MLPASQYADFIRQTAQRLGFAFVGIAKAGFMDEEARRLEAWLEAGYHGQMHYMAQHFDKRVDPAKLVPGAKTVLSLMYNYHNPDSAADPDAPKVSQYAYGEDYHHVIKGKLRELLAEMRQHIGPVEGRAFVDSAPVLERDWARRSGLGWVGRHTLLIHPRHGSYYFLAELIIDLELPADQPMRDYCGTCTRCIEACPTEAISPQGYVVDGSRCIAYLTIELREAIPDAFKGKMDNWAFGCDVCQAVCPWNRFSQRHQEPAFEPHPDLLGLSRRDWLEMTEEVFGRVFRKSAVKRAKYGGLMRNIRFLAAGDAAGESDAPLS